MSDRLLCARCGRMLDVDTFGQPMAHVCLTTNTFTLGETRVNPLPIWCTCPCPTVCSCRCPVVHLHGRWVLS